MSDAIDTMLELAERQRDAAQVALMAAEAHGERALAQLDQLQSYRAEYRSRAPGSGGTAAPIELLRCHQGFMQRLDQALAQQHEVVRRAQTESDRRRQLLLQAELQLASVRKLVERRQAEQQRVVMRREQRQADEVGQQRHQRRTATGFGGLH